MSGGNAHTTMISTPSTEVSPTVSSNSVVAVSGNIANGASIQKGTSEGTGGQFSLGINFLNLNQQPEYYNNYQNYGSMAIRPTAQPVQYNNMDNSGSLTLGLLI